MNKKELSKIINVIDNDRISEKDAFIELVECDLNNLLKDYFEYGSYPKVNINKSSDGYSINIALKVDRIKNFSTIPKNVNA